MQIGKSIKEAKDILENQGIVAIPTETVYGLAANALSTKAILKVFEAKNRPKFDPLIVHVKSINVINKYAHLSPILLQLAQEYWPGPLTILAQKKDCISDLVTAGSPMVAVRVPSHTVANSLLGSLDFPLVAPSANTFGYVSPTNAKHVLENLGGKVDYILDGGNTEIGLESTIISEEKEEIIIHRLGAIPVESIEDFLGKKAILKIQNNSNPQAPGMLDKHYSPVCRLEEYNKDKDLDKNATIIWFGPKPPKGFNAVINLSLTESLDEAASQLFTVLRNLDKTKTQLAYVKKVPEKGLGRAINDRLSRATIN